MKKTGSTAYKASKFNAKNFEKPGLGEDEVLEIKEAFDLFDIEGNGSIDPRCIYAHNNRTQISHDKFRF